MPRTCLITLLLLTLGGDSGADDNAPATSPYDPTAVVLDAVGRMDVGPLDWPQFGGSSHRNNTPYGENIPTHWDAETGENILWSTPIGRPWLFFGALSVANGKLFLGTNNYDSYVARFPEEIDLACLLCFDAQTGEFLWQHSNARLPSGRRHDWPGTGICSIPYCRGDRLWYVTNRACVCCLDAEGFRDGENDGPYVSDDNENIDEADVIWEFDMMQEYGVSPHERSTCSCTGYDDVLFVNTGNGVAQNHNEIPAPDAPSFLALNIHTGEVLWTDNSPGANILHGQWSSPAIAELGGVPQVIFGGGDGWLYSFTIEGDGHGNAELLWKFDGNPKEAKFILGASGTRNEIMAPPVVYDGLVYLVMGQDPEHGEGLGHLWCIDPTQRGDVSAELAVDDSGNVIPHRRTQAVILENGERSISNPNSAVVWSYTAHDQNGDVEISWEEEMHRSLGTVSIKNDLAFVADFSGLLHCLNARTGESYWTYDLFAACWTTPMIVEDKIYVCDEEGDVAIFELSREMNMVAEVNTWGGCFATPVVANNILYVCSNDTLFAIAEGAQTEGE